MYKYRYTYLVYQFIFYRKHERFSALGNYMKIIVFIEIHCNCLFFSFLKIKILFKLYLIGTYFVYFIILILLCKRMKYSTISFQLLYIWCTVKWTASRAIDLVKVNFNTVLTHLITSRYLKWAYFIIFQGWYNS